MILQHIDGIEYANDLVQGVNGEIMHYARGKTVLLLSSAVL